jgi:4-carboxymuconolactone decarboxylase
MSEPSARPRLAPIPEALFSEAQRRVVQALIAGPRGRVSGPFVALLRSPELCARTQQLGAYLRFDSLLPQRLRELAILATARHWRQNYEWQTHAPIAEQAGVPRKLIASLAADQDCSAEAADEDIVLRFCRELHGRHGVGDELYEQARVLLGEDGVVELCALCGYYALLAMVLNVARTPVPTGAEAPFLQP